MIKRMVKWAALAPLLASTGVAGIGQASVSVGHPSHAANGRRTWRLSYQLRHSQLFNIAATGPRSAWAVGYRTNSQGKGISGLLLHWNGTRWRPWSFPHERTYFPFAVSSPSPDDVWMFPFADSSPAEPLHWNGRSWKVLDTQIFQSDGLVVSDSDIWTGGLDPRCAGPVHFGTRGCTVLANWDGHSWHDYVLPTFVQSVAADSATDVWAVGLSWIKGPGRPGRPQAFRWNGSSWTRVPLRAARTENLQLAVGSRKDVWISAVPPRNHRACAMHWGGSRWRAFSGPPPDGDSVCGTPYVPDGHGGLWFGPFEHWTGRKLVGPWPVFPFEGNNAVGVSAMTTVPHTSSLWLTGWMLAGSKDERIGYIAVLGQRPA